MGDGYRARSDHDSTSHFTNHQWIICHSPPLLLTKLSTDEKTRLDLAYQDRNSVFLDY